jgi:hypothetical protein
MRGRKERNVKIKDRSCDKGVALELLHGSIFGGLTGNSKRGKGGLRACTQKHLQLFTTVTDVDG